MSVLVNFAMFPTDKGTSVSPYVAKVEKTIRDKGFESQLGPMSTVVETNTLAEALDVIAAAYAVLEPDCSRVYLSANFDIKKSEMGRLRAKVESVEEKIAKL